MPPGSQQLGVGELGKRRLNAGRRQPARLLRHVRPFGGRDSHVEAILNMMMNKKCNEYLAGGSDPIGHAKVLCDRRKILGLGAHSLPPEHTKGGGDRLRRAPESRFESEIGRDLVSEVKRTSRERRDCR